MNNEYPHLRKAPRSTLSISDQLLLINEDLANISDDIEELKQKLNPAPAPPAPPVNNVP